MKSIQVFMMALAAFSVAAQDTTPPPASAVTTTDAAGTGVLPPSPTDSVGCEPHGDHWHCDGPATATDDHDDHDHEDEETGVLPPSPTESVGCEPHGDHWHCDGPRVTDASAVTTATHDHDDEDHDHSATGVLPPSPTESVDCEPHGDHWHCDGPRSTLNTGAGVDANATVTSTFSPIEQTTNAAAVVGVGVEGVILGGALMILGL